MVKARLKVDITNNLKEGTELVKYGNVFCNEQTCFTADLIYGNPNFEVFETSEMQINNSQPSN